MHIPRCNDSQPSPIDPLYSAKVGITLRRDLVWTDITLPVAVDLWGHLRRLPLVVYDDIWKYVTNSREDGDGRQYNMDA